MELIKTQMQVCGQNGITDAFKTIYTDGGLKGLGRGFGITVLREVPAFGVYFGSYEVMIRYTIQLTILLISTPSIQEFW